MREMVEPEILSERRVHNCYISKNAGILHGYAGKTEVSGKRDLSHYGKPSRSRAILRHFGKANGKG